MDVGMPQMQEHICGAVQEVLMLWKL